MTGKKVATFRERLAELVDSSPKSRTDIASEFGVAKQTVSAWLTGQNSPRLPVVVALAEYFGVTVEWLNGFDVPKIVSKPENSEPPDNEKPLSSDARILAQGFDKLPKEQQERALAMFRVMFEPQYAHLFTKGPEDDDT